MRNWASKVVIWEVDSFKESEIGNTSRYLASEPERVEVQLDDTLTLAAANTSPSAKSEGLVLP
jgi:hypothetical protein